MTVEPIQDAGKAAGYFKGRSGDPKQGEYYLSPTGKGGEPAGRWHGAEALGLAGEITGDQLREVLSGLEPGTKRSLLQANKKGHRPGWDCTLSAPKSVSAIWAVASPELRQQIEAAHEKAVIETKNYLDERAGYTRRGKGGKEREQVELIAAEYRHSTNRNDEPHLHSHLLIMNMAKRVDGTWGTIESRYIMQHQLAAGTLYQVALSRELSQRGFTIQPGRGGTFDVAGVPPEIVRLWSTRHAEIAAELEKAGITTSRGEGAEVAFHETRRHKSYTDPAILRERWAEQARTNGWGPEAAAALTTRGEEVKAPHLPVPKSKYMDDEKSLIRELGARLYGRATPEEVRALAEDVSRDSRSALTAARAMAFDATKAKPVKLAGATREELLIRLSELGQLVPPPKPGDKLPDAAWQKARDTARWMLQSDTPAIVEMTEKVTAAAEKLGRDPDDARRWMEDRLAKALAKSAFYVDQAGRRKEILDLAVGPAFTNDLTGPTAKDVHQAVATLREAPNDNRVTLALHEARRLVSTPALRPLVEKYSQREADPVKAEAKVIQAVATGLVSAADYADRRVDGHVRRDVSAVISGLMQTVREDELAAERLAREEEATRAKRRQLELGMDR